jgi:hypothetical protein
MESNNKEGTNNMDVTIKMTGSGLDYNGTITLFQAAQIMAAIAKPGDTRSNDSQPELLAGDVVTKPQELKSVSSVYESPRQAQTLTLKKSLQLHCTSARIAKTVN